MHYQDDEVPEAKFSYDISPLATVISSKKRAWYEFLTSLMAIIGGTFTGELLGRDGCFSCGKQYLCSFLSSSKRLHYKRHNPQLDSFDFLPLSPSLLPPFQCWA